MSYKPQTLHRKMAELARMAIIRYASFRADKNRQNTGAMLTMKTVSRAWGVMPRETVLRSSGQIHQPSPNYPLNNVSQCRAAGISRNYYRKRIIQYKKNLGIEV